MSKILVVSPYYWPATNGGGGQVSVENMVSKLIVFNDITVLCNRSNDNTDINKNFIRYKEGVEIVYFSKFNFFRLFFFLNKRKFDVVYFNSFFSALCILSQLFLIFNSTVIKIFSPKGELYEGALMRKNLLKKCWIFLFRRFLKKNVLHATSLQEAKLLKNIFPDNHIKLARDIPSEKLETNLVLNGQHDERFKLIFCSSIVPKKNIEYIISILKGIKSPIIFDIWGQAFDSHYLRSILFKLNKLPPNIFWNYNGSLPFSEAKNIFRSYDLFILPTLGENYGHVIYESLACGCPVLISKDTTPWNNLEKKGIGFDISLNDSNQWVNKINLIINTSLSDRIKQRRKCINYIKKEFDIRVIVEENQSLFKF